MRSKYPPMAYINGIYGWAEMLLKWKFSDEPWFRIVFPTYGGLLDGRNETMLKNIENGFHEHPEANQMLVIIGRAHVRGMKKLLEDQGFTNTLLPPLPDQP